MSRDVSGAGLRRGSYNSLPRPSIHSSNNSDIEYSCIPQCSARAPYNPSWLDGHPHASFQSHTSRSCCALVLIESVLKCFHCVQPPYCLYYPPRIITLMSTARRTLPNQPPLPTSIWRRFALSTHNRHSAIQRQFNVIWLLFSGGLVGVALELREPSTLPVDDEV